MPRNACDDHHSQEVKEKLAAYDHYSDGELMAAAAAADSTAAVATLKGKVVTRLGLEAFGVVLLLCVVLGAVAASDNPDVISASVTVASLGGSIVVFAIAFDYIRLQHVGRVMASGETRHDIPYPRMRFLPLQTLLKIRRSFAQAGSKWAEPVQLKAHVASMADRTMGGRPLLRGGTVRTDSESNPVASGGDAAD